MRITPDGTSKTLTELFGPEIVREIQKRKHESAVSIGLIALTGTVYVETVGFEATVANGRPLNTIPFVIDETQTGDVSLITDGGVADVRVIVS